MPGPASDIPRHPRLDIPRVPLPGTRRGATTIQLATMVAGIGIATAVLVPHIFHARFEADAAQRVVRATLVRAQRLALQGHSAVMVSVDTAGRRLRLWEDSDRDGVFGPDDRISWQALPANAHFATPAVPLPGAPSGSEGLSGSMLRYVDGFPSVVFHRNGSATSDAVAYLAASAGALEELRAVLLDQSSGRSETYRFADGRWEQDER